MTTPLHHPSIPSSTTPPNPQENSPLFITLPPELRTLIFTYTLTSYPNPDPLKTYDKETYWSRPGYTAPQITSTALLRTCKRVYAETWFLPFALSEHTIYLTARERAPGNHLNDSAITRPRLNPGSRFRSRSGDGNPNENGNGNTLRQSLSLINDIHGPLQETGNIQVFAQLYLLEPGRAFQAILDAPYLKPRAVRLTIRYTDFWHWERCEPLWIDGRWVQSVRFPDTVREFRMDFEMIERRKGEVEVLVSQAVERWVFRRRDGKVLRAGAGAGDVVVTKWTGSSVFGGRRWVRDEVRPGELDYVVYTVTWRVDSSSGPDPAQPGRSQTMGDSDGEHGDSDGDEHEDSSDDNGNEAPTIRVPANFIQPAPPLPDCSSLPESEMRLAGVTAAMPAAEAVAAVQAFRRHMLAARTRSMVIGQGTLVRQRWDVP